LDLVQASVAFLFRGQASDEANELMFCIGRNFANRQFHWESAAILPLTHDHVSDTDDTLLPSREVPRQVAIMPLPIWFWHQQPNIFSKYLAFRVTKESFCYDAEIADKAFAVDDHHRVRHGGNNGLQVSLLVPQRLLTPCQVFIGGTKLIYRPLMLKVVRSDSGGQQAQ
jgi:hypothetical protein